MAEENLHQEPVSTWDLGVNRFAFERAADGWEKVGELLRSRADNLVTRIATLLDAGWSGEFSNAFEDYRRRLVTDLDAAATLAEEYSSRLHDLARVAASTGEALARNFESLPAEYVRNEAPFGFINYYEFTFKSEVADTFYSLLQEAHTLRQDYFEYQNKLYEGLEDWESLAIDWEGAALGSQFPISLSQLPYDSPPGESPAAQVLMIDGEVVINAGDGDNEIEVTYHNGYVRVTVDGALYSYRSDTPITIRGGAGNDTIKVADDVDANLTILGSEGHNTIIAGGQGERTVIGGLDDDQIFGSTGDDYLSGSIGDDYIEVQSGDNVITGGWGDDVIYGGDGRDTISSPDGMSHIDTGLGGGAVFAHDEYQRDGFVSAGADTPIVSDRYQVVQMAETPDLPFIEIEGSPEFVSRVRADLAAMQAEENSVLDRLADNQSGGFLSGGHNIVIRESDLSGITESTRREESVPALGGRNTVIHYDPAMDYAKSESPYSSLRSELATEGYNWSQ